MCKVDREGGGGEESVCVCVCEREREREVCDVRTNQNVRESKSDHKVRQPIHDGCYGDSNGSSFLEKQLSHHQPRNGT